MSSGLLSIFSFKTKIESTPKRDFSQWAQNLIIGVVMRYLSLWMV